MKFSRQFDQMDCGPACVRMVASYYGKDYPLSYLRSLAHLTREGVSVAGIRDSLTAIGMNSATFEMSLEQLYTDCPLPAILYWDQNHFVVLEKLKGRSAQKARYKIANPAFGKQWFSAEELCRHWSNGGKGIVVAVEPNEDFYQKTAIKERHSLRDFARKYILPYKAQLIQSLLALLVGTLLGLISPFLAQSVVDDGIALHDMSLITTILIAQLALFIGSFLMSTIGAWVGLYMSTQISIGILGDYLRKLLKLPMTFFETKSIGDYQQRLSDHSRLQSFMTGSTLETLFSLLSVPFYMAIIIFYSPLVLAVFLGFTIISTLWMTYFFRKRKSLDYEQFKVSVDNQNKLYEMMSGITDIKVNAYDDYKLSEWQHLQMRQYAMSQKSLKLGQIQNTGFTIIGQLRNIIITYWIAMLVVNNELTLGMMMSISTIIGMISGPLGQLTGFLQQYQDAKISLERSQEVPATQLPMALHHAARTDSQRDGHGFRPWRQPPVDVRGPQSLRGGLPAQPLPRHGVGRQGGRPCRRGQSPQRLARQKLRVTSRQRADEALDAILPSRQHTPPGDDGLHHAESTVETQQER